MSKFRETPEVNAGSMADIAFLLLIFFLVTTTLETNAGIKRMLPRKDGKAATISEKNILRVNINGRNQLMVEGEIMDLKNFRQIAIDFLDNGGAALTSEHYCDYCNGKRLNNSSDSPQRAVVSISTNRKTTYETYIAVQNELVGAYTTLRNREAKRLFGTSFERLKLDYANSKNNTDVRLSLKEKIERVQGLYPMKISEAQLKN